VNIIPTVSNPSLSEIGSKGLFTRDLEEALLSGKVDAVVHSWKDLPLEDTPGLAISAIPKRGAVQDVLVAADGKKLTDLPEGARVGTFSSRRAAQLLAYRTDLTILPTSGSVDSLVRKVSDGEYDAIVLAQAVLMHLGLESHISEIFPLDVILPSPGQGALAVQCRVDDAETLQLLSSIHDPLTAAAVQAERAFLAGLGGDSSLPVAAFAQKTDGKIILTGAVISPDGKQAIRLSAVDQDPHKLGKWLADLVLERGAADLLKALA
jgi:hydroxymethylbilane synthase